MNANTTLDQVRALAEAKLAQLQPLAGEEMTLPSFDPRREGFIDGERTLATQILKMIDGAGTSHDLVTTDPVEDEMVMSLGQT